MNEVTVSKENSIAIKDLDIGEMFTVVSLPGAVFMRASSTLPGAVFMRASSIDSNAFNLVTGMRHTFDGNTACTVVKEVRIKAN